MPSRKRIQAKRKQQRDRVHHAAREAHDVLSAESAHTAVILLARSFVSVPYHRLSFLIMGHAPASTRRLLTASMLLSLRLREAGLTWRERECTDWLAVTDHFRTHQCAAVALCLVTEATASATQSIASFSFDTALDARVGFTRISVLLSRALAMRGWSDAGNIARHACDLITYVIGERERANQPRDHDVLWWYHVLRFANEETSRRVYDMYRKWIALAVKIEALQHTLQDSDKTALRRKRKSKPRALKQLRSDKRRLEVMQKVMDSLILPSKACAGRLASLTTRQWFATLVNVFNQGVHDVTIRGISSF